MGQQTFHQNSPSLSSGVNFTSNKLSPVGYPVRTIEMMPSERNWAFIDMQNLYQGVQEYGWRIDWSFFRKYLRDVYSVSKAVVFMGYLKEFEGLYISLRRAGFVLEFREVRRMADGTIDGGNVDADLASYVMDYKTAYSKAIIVADDGDYCRTVKSLSRQNKLKLIISSHTIKNTSEMIKQAIGRNRIVSIHAIRNLIEFSKIPNNKNIKS